MVKVGDKVNFKPAAWENVGIERSWCGASIPATVTGTVVEIHITHGWYRVEYELNGKTYSEGLPLDYEADYRRK